MKLWKVLGLAGLAGVAATGVAVTRAERRRRSYEPDDVRARLHERYREAAEVEGPSGPAERGVEAPAEPSLRDAAPGCLAAGWGRVRHPRRGR